MWDNVGHVRRGSNRHQYTRTHGLRPRCFRLWTWARSRGSGHVASRALSRPRLGVLSRGPRGERSYPGRPPVGDWVGPVGAACARGLVVAHRDCLLGASFGARLTRNSASSGQRQPDDAGSVVGRPLARRGRVGARADRRRGATELSVRIRPPGSSASSLESSLCSLFSTAGSFLVGFACLGLILIGRAAFSFIALARLIVRISAQTAARIDAASHAVVRAWRQAREIERSNRERTRHANEPHIDTSPRDKAIVAVSPLDLDLDEALVGPLLEPASAPERTPKGLSDKRGVKTRARDAKADAPVTAGTAVGTGEETIAAGAAHAESPEPETAATSETAARKPRAGPARRRPSWTPPRRLPRK